MKEHIQLQASGQVCVPIGSGLRVRQIDKDASENPMRVVQVEKMVVSARVGESGDRSVRVQRTLRQAEKQDSAIQEVSEVWKERGKSPDLVISTLQRATNPA